MTAYGILDIGQLRMLIRDRVTKALLASKMLFGEESTNVANTAKDTCSGNKSKIYLRQSSPLKLIYHCQTPLENERTELLPRSF